jgi:hypothetical protein
MAIHTRVVTPITTQGFRSPEDATQLECDGVKVDFVNIETGPVVRTRVFESRGTTEHRKSVLVLELFLNASPPERMVEPAVVPQCNILRCPSGRAPTEGVLPCIFWIRSLAL